MDKQVKIFIGVAVVSFVVAVSAVIFSLSSDKPKTVFDLGAAGNMLAEEYMPYVLYNGGYKSAKPIETTSTFAVTGASTLTGNVSAGGTLAVTGATTLTGAATLSSTLDVTATSTVGTNDLVVHTGTGRVGIGTTTPDALLTIGANVTGTTTLNFAKFCLKGNDTGGTLRYVYLNTNGDLATSTTACN